MRFLPRLKAGVPRTISLMKSIEERAKEYILTNANYVELPTRRWGTSVRQQQDAYMAGATEQRVIDEEVRLKKCDDMTEAEYNRETAFADWYHKNGKGTPTYSDAIEWARKDLLDKVFEYAQARYDLDYCGNVKDVLDYLKSLVEE